MPFRFKKFEIDDTDCTMKVGTDAVLLGAWVYYKNPRHILDIGSGCGIIALMMAQKFSMARINAVEIDEMSCIRARKNANHSPWPEQIQMIHSSLQEYLNKNSPKYDLVVSNPPFFSKSLLPENKKYVFAKHTKKLDYATLLHAVKCLLTPSGACFVIIPYEAISVFNKEVYMAQLFYNNDLIIFPKPGKPANRAILKITKSKIPTDTKKLLIRNSKNTYTADYKELTKDFYLHF